MTTRSTTAMSDTITPLVMPKWGLEMREGTGSE